MLNKLITSAKTGVTITLALSVSCSPSQDRIKPKTGNINESVYATVTVQPDSLYAAYASVSGIVNKVFVREGDAVEQGSSLIQITNDVSRINTENAKLALDLARRNYEGNTAILNELQEEIDVARLTLQRDSLLFYRQKKLWEGNVGTQNEYDSRKTAYNIARRNFNALLNRYDRIKRELQTQLRQAENRYEAALVATGDYTIASRINGKVYQLFKEPGELVSPQEPVASLGSAENFFAELLIDEEDIGQITTGQRVLITLDAYAGQVYQARLTVIYPQKDERTQTFTAEAEFMERPERLYPGLNGEANIIIRQKKNAIIIPVDYLVDEKYVETDDGLIEVETGLRNMEKVEILTGLDTGTFIYKP